MPPCDAGFVALRQHKATWRTEKGKPSTNVAVYAALLWAYGLIDRLADLADPSKDEEGTRLSLSREPARARHRRTLSNDF